MGLRLQHLQRIVTQPRTTQCPHDLLGLRTHDATGGDGTEHPEAAGKSHQVASVHVVSVRRQEIGQGIRRLVDHHVIGMWSSCDKFSSIPHIDVRVLGSAVGRATVRLVEQLIELGDGDAQQFRETGPQHEQRLELAPFPPGDALLGNAQSLGQRLLGEAGQTA
jgi:hypothetical protein